MNWARFRKGRGVVILILATSCTLPQDWHDYESIMHDVHQTIEQVAEPGYQDDWQLPQETLARGAGDCEDLSLLFMDNVYLAYGVKGRLVAIDSFLYPGTDYSHAIVEIDGVYYDTSYNTLRTAEEIKIKRSYSYNWAMYLAKYIH